MQYNVKTPKEYMDSIEEDWRKEVLLKLREIILNSSFDVSEAIEYKMLRYGDENSSVFHLNAQKNYVSLYVGDTKKIDEMGDLLTGLDISKGCIRFKRSTHISNTRIKEFIVQALNLWNSGGDTSC